MKCPHYKPNLHNFMQHQNIFLNALFPAFSPLPFPFNPNLHVYQSFIFKLLTVHSAPTRRRCSVSASGSPSQHQNGILRARSNGVLSLPICWRVKGGCSRGGDESYQPRVVHHRRVDISITSQPSLSLLLQEQGTDALLLKKKKKKRGNYLRA